MAEIWLSGFKVIDKKIKFNLIIFCGLALPLLASAVPPVFHEVTAFSPNQRYRVDITAPADEKTAGKRKKFQKIFKVCIAMTDTQARKTVWNKVESFNADDLSFPRRAFVADSGVAVLKSPHDIMTFYSPRGKELGGVALQSWLPDRALRTYDRSYFIPERRGLLSEEDIKRYASTDGFWEGGALFYFLDTPATHLFVIRTWWGKRMFIDILKCESVATDEELDKAADECEKNYVTHILEEGIRKEEAREKINPREDFILNLLSAIFWVGKSGDRNAVPLLRKLERSTWRSGSVLQLDSAVTNRKTLRKAKKLNPFSYATYKVKQASQSSLRQLCEQPQPPGGVAIIELRSFDETPESREYPLKATDRPREGMVEQLRKNMTAEQVLAQLGYPDFINVGSRTWEYDIDGDDPYTLVLKWSAANRVYSLRASRPPLWQDNEDRDKMLALSLF